MSAPVFPSAIVNFGSDPANGQTIMPADVAALRAEVTALETLLKALSAGYLTNDGAGNLSWSAGGGGSGSGWNADTNTWTY